MPQRKASPSKPKGSSKSAAGGGRGRSTASRKPPPRKPPPRKAAPSSSPSEPQAAAPADSALAQSIGVISEAITRGALSSLNLVLLTGERIQEAMDDAVRRGRMTRADANDLVAELVRRGRRQTEDVLADVDQLLGQGRDQIESASADARRRAGRAQTRARRAGTVDRVMREADRARRSVGVGPSFPISGFEDLTAAQVSGRLGDLTPAELRKVRDHERRHANRKSVLAAIERKLS